MTLELTTEVADGLAKLASLECQSVEEYLAKHVQRELSEDGWIEKNGFLVYTGGKDLPPGTLENAVQGMREERDQHVWGADD